jgi:hypothetical protein
MFPLSQVVDLFEQRHIVLHEPCLPLFVLRHIFLYLLLDVLNVLLQEVSLFVYVLVRIPFIYYLFQNVLLVQIHQLFFQFFMVLDLLDHAPHIALKFLLEVLL